MVELYELLSTIRHDKRKRTYIQSHRIGLNVIQRCSQCRERKITPSFAVTANVDEQTLLYYPIRINEPKNFVAIGRKERQDKRW